MTVAEKPLAAIQGRHRATGDGVHLVANAYRKGHRIEPHMHREAQLVYAAVYGMCTDYTNGMRNGVQVVLGLAEMPPEWRARR